MARFAEIENEICLSVEAIAEAVGMTFDSGLNTVKKGLERYRSRDTESWKHYADESDNRRKWVIYNYLPEATMSRVDHYWGDVRLQYYTEMLTTEALSRIDIKDKSYFAGRGLTGGKADQLAEACGWLRLCNSNYWVNKWDGRTVYMQWAARVIGDRNLYGFKVGSARSLRRKIKQWKTDGRASLIPKSKGNNNATKVSKEGIIRIMNLYADRHKPSVKTVADIYNREAKEKGWALLTDERVRQIVTEPKNLQIAILARHGTEAARNLLERTIKRRKPSFADALWTMDGTAVQLIYREGKKMRSDLYIYAIVDAYSGAIIGKAFGASETSTLVQAALRDATTSTGRLPYQLQYDNSGANKSAEATQLFNKMARAAFPTSPYNGKAKVIEMIFGQFEQANLRYFDNFKGGNITARSLNTRANPDHLANYKSVAGKKGLPTKEQVVAQMMLAIEVHNHTMVKGGKTRIEHYHTKDSRRQEIPYLSMVDMFWVERKHKVRYTKDGIVMEVGKKRYYYEVESEHGVEDMEFRLNWLGSTFTVKYDPDDLEYINLYDAGVWIATAHEKNELAMAKADAEKGEGEILSKSYKARDKYLKILSKEKEILNEMDEGAVMDHQLVHKDAYNRMERKQLDQLIEATGRGRVVTTEHKPRKRKYAMYEAEANGEIIE